MVAKDRILDFGLSALTTESDRVFLCTVDPVDYAAANTTHVGVKIGTRGSMYYPISSPPQGGRLASLAGFFDGDITSNGTANYVIVADSVNQNLLISELIVNSQVVVASGKFTINGYDVIFGATSQPQAANLTVGSPVISPVVFSKTQPQAVSLAIGSPVISSPTLIAAQTGWTNIPVNLQTGTFTCEFDAVPSAASIDNVLGLSNGPAAAYTDVACAVLFSLPGSVIQARNGGSYAALVSVPYTANQEFHIRMLGNLNNHLYSVWVTPFGQSEVQIASNYAFRTEQAAVTQLNNFARNATDLGIVNISNLSLTSLIANPLTVGSPVLPTLVLNNKASLTASNFVTASPAFNVAAFNQTAKLLAITFVDSPPAFTSPSIAINGGNPAGAFANQNNTDFTISWSAVPTQSSEDVVTGLSFNAPVDFTSFACGIRFSSTGVIDVRNDSSYGATTTVPYAGGLSYTFRLIVRMSDDTYDVFITPQGQSEVTLASNFLFRTEQVGIATINYLGKLMTLGDATLSNRIGPSPAPLPPIVFAGSFNVNLPATNGQVVGTMFANYNPTTWAITAGNTAGHFAISNTGVITVTSAGASGIVSGNNYSLTCRATNSFGNGSNTASVSASGGGAVAAPVITNLRTQSTNNTIFNISNGGNTYSNNLNVFGTGTSGATVNVKDGATTLGTTTVDGSGNWVYRTGAILSDTSHSFTATQTISGSTGSASNTRTCNVQSSVPSVPSSGNNMVVSGRTYSTDTANQPWSMVRVDSHNLQFEVRNGDIATQTGSHRSELDGGAAPTLPEGTTFHITYEFNMTGGPVNDAFGSGRWFIIGQMHDTDISGASPPLGIGLGADGGFSTSGDDFMVEIGSRTASSGSITYTTLYLATTPITRSTWYNISVIMKISSAGSGILQVSKDGVQIVNYTGPLGYNTGSNTYYWKYGIYRGESTQTQQIQYRNMLVVIA